MKKSLSVVLLIVFIVAGVFLNESCGKAQASKLRFEISFLSSVHAESITGRVFIMISRNKQREPRLQAGFWMRSVPFFGVDVEGLEPGEKAEIDENTLGFPLKSLRDIPPGDYFVQGLINVYTEFHRSDGHVIWAHKDQWEGQRFNRSPGNLYSEIQSVHLEPSKGYTIKLRLDK
ncbi:unnamed protein product, partial [marine sediment metagenome]